MSTICADGDGRNNIFDYILFSGRYQALSCLLQRAAGDATPNRILRLRPTFIRELVGIIVLSRDVSSAACSLLIEFIRSLSPTDPSLVRNQWVPEVAQRLCSAVQNERVNVTDYLLPEIVVKLDSACLPSLMLEIHKQRPQLPPTGVLWGLCSAVMHARLQSLPGAVISSTGSSHDTLALKDLLSACTSDDADLRLLALSIPVLSQKTVTPISSSDMSVFKFAFVYSLKSSLPDHRHKLARIVTLVLSRLKETVRVCTRNMTAKLRGPDEYRVCCVAVSCSQIDFFILMCVRMRKSCHNFKRRRMRQRVSALGSAKNLSATCSLALHVRDKSRRLNCCSAHYRHWMARCY